MRTDVCVIGGGAAGLMAAITAAEGGARVQVLEREERPGRKLRITGKGRCNVTNASTPEEVMKHITRNSRFLFSAMNAFPPEQVMDFFARLGVPLKTERGNRVFPVSDHAEDIVDALTREARRLGVSIRRLRVSDIELRDGAVNTVVGRNTRIDCAAAILCTGGLSYPKTGSTGDGYGIAEKLGHSVTETRPSLVPLTSEDTDCAEMQGLSLKNVTLSLFDGRKKPVYSELGEMQFTHFGMTGPLILSASAHMEEGKSYYAVIDLKPGLGSEKLDARLVRLFQEQQNKDYKNALDDLLPRLMIPVILRRSGIPPETKCNAITKAQRQTLLDNLKHFRVDISGTRPIDEAVITRGGVCVKEIDPGSMMSRLVPGLYFAGEILDLDAYTGGYNLQIAWATGRAAGSAAAEAAKGAKP